MNHIRTGHLPMTCARTANCVLLLMTVTGLAPRGAGGAAGLHLVVGMAISYVCFLWYCDDSDARGFRRSRCLSALIVALPLATIPYYLLCSRPASERGKALLVYAGCLALMPVAAWVGAAVRLGFDRAV